MVDTSVLVAAVDRLDSRHPECDELLATDVGPLYVPQLCIAETAHLLERHGPADACLGLHADFAAARLVTEPVAPPDWLRIAELVAQYRDLRLGTVDASVVAAAERLGATRIATLDRRHFAAVRPLHADAFELLP